jgi:membrane protein
MLAAFAKYIGGWLPEFAMQAVGFLVSFAFITLMFAMMFKWLPDTQVAWRDVWLGAAVTALLFEIGKSLIGLYIGKQGLESTFGTAASLVVLLIWVYYSSQIVLMGAEFTRAYASKYGVRRKRAIADNPSLALQTRSAIGTGQTAVQTGPYAAAMLAICAGWLLARMMEERGGAAPSVGRR